MRPNRHPDHGDGHFWPAYVDALTNVILNLLFFVALMAVCVFSLGLGANGKSSEFLSALSMLAQQPASAELRFHVTPQSEPEKQNQSSFIQITPQAIGSEKKLRLTFKDAPIATSEADQTAQQQAQQEEVRKTLVNRLVNSKASIKLWVECECRDPTEQRASYLHVMSVRNALIAMGASPEKISMRMVSDHIKVSNPDAVFIEWENTQSVE